MAQDELRERVIGAIRTVHDPEIPVNVYDLGLIYELDVREDGAVHATMTLTAPNCPVADQIVADVERKIRGTEGVREASVRLTFDPPWTTERMTDVAQIELEAMGIDPRRAKEQATGGAAGLTIGRRRPGERPG